MPELHLEALRQPQQTIWSLFQGEAEILRSHGFYLAGGTALALQLGHRESQDFDFFSTQPDIEPVRDWLESLPEFTLRDADAHTLHGELSGVKISFIAHYRYPLLLPPVKAGDLVMADLLDIALMKFLAVTHRATLRDYLDLAVILRDRFPLRILIDKSVEKFGPAFNPMLSVRALVHFDDLDEEIPILIDSSLATSWRQVLRFAVRELAP